jgi:hypothetical protein
VSLIDVSSGSYAAAHAVYDVGDGAGHLAGFVAAGYTASTAVALLNSAVPLRRFGWIGVALAGVQLLNAPYQIFSMAHRSTVVGSVVLVAFIAWVGLISIVLVTSRRGGTRAPVVRAPI